MSRKNHSERVKRESFKPVDFRSYFRSYPNVGTAVLAAAYPTLFGAARSSSICCCRFSAPDERRDGAFVGHGTFGETEGKDARLN